MSSPLEGQGLYRHTLVLRVLHSKQADVIFSRRGTSGALFKGPLEGGGGGLAGAGAGSREERCCSIWRQILLFALDNIQIHVDKETNDQIYLFLRQICHYLT